MRGSGPIGSSTRFLVTDFRASFGLRVRCSDFGLMGPEFGVSPRIESRLAACQESCHAATADVGADSRRSAKPVATGVLGCSSLGGACFPEVSRGHRPKHSRTLPNPFGKEGILNRNVNPPAPPPHNLRSFP